ncbi:MAG TPA: hypothetical protein VGE13_01670 [Candidatus Saccharimonadales bacterium]
MTDININAGLAVKADVNKLYGDVAGTVAKFREDRRYNKEAYNELLDKYSVLVTDIEAIRNQLNELVEAAQANKVPDEQEIKAMDAMFGLVGAKKQDGSLDFQKLMELNNTFGNK